MLSFGDQGAGGSADGHGETHRHRGCTSPNAEAQKGRDTDVCVGGSPNTQAEPSLESCDLVLLFNQQETRIRTQELGPPSAEEEARLAVREAPQLP